MAKKITSQKTKVFRIMSATWCVVQNPEARQKILFQRPELGTVSFKAGGIAFDPSV